MRLDANTAQWDRIEMRKKSPRTLSTFRCTSLAHTQSAGAPL